jgi:hypothetical protein
MIVISPEHEPTLARYSIIPSVLCAMGMMALASYRVKNETTHQIVWFVAFVLESSLLTANMLAWRGSFRTEIKDAMLPFKSEDPISLLDLTTLGWSVDY